VSASVHVLGSARPARSGLPPARPGGSPRKGLVTPSVCLTGETFDTEAPFFLDWITVAQDHPAGGLPVIDSGAVWAADADGAIQWKTTQRVQHQGSFETSVNVRCDGFRVEFSGNVSRFGRPDNLFGFGWRECFRRINAILAYYELPPFTAGECVQRPNGRGAFVTTWTGARISRLDLTANYEAGSAEAAHLVLQYLGTQHNGRKNGRVLGNGETVDWGKKAGAKTARQYWKAYIKHLELQRHGTADERVVEYCRERGIVRFEGTLRTKTLTDLGCAYLGEYERGWAMGQLVILFNEQSAVMSRAERSTDDLDELPRHLRATARDYLAGMDLTATLSRATFFRHRRDLLSYGIDISVRNVSPFQPRVRVVQLRAAEVPSWYQLAA
jgi:Phage X family/Phage replication protein CRI